MANSVTVKEVARIAEVSIGTVSRALNNHSNVNKITKQKVLKAASELGYNKPNKPALNPGLSSLSIKEIGFFLYTFDFEAKNSGQDDPFWLSILHGVEEESHNWSIRVFYQQINRLLAAPQRLLNLIDEMELDGIVLVGPSTEEVVNLLQSTNLPVVLLDNHLAKVRVDSILSDNFQGAKLAVEHLIENRHSEIAFLSGPCESKGLVKLNKIYSFEQRAEGYRRALLEANIRTDYELFEECEITPEGGYAACQRLLARQAKFSAIFCVNDPIAIGAIKALKEAGLRVPEDVSVVGFDDINLAQHLTPALTTVRVEKEQIGALGVNRLIERSRNKQGVKSTTLLEVELIKRDSVRPRL